MKSRTTTGIIRLGDIQEEKARKHMKGARRGVQAIDVGGYRISRTHTTIRKRNAPKIIRCLERCWREYKQTGTLKRQRACQLISRNGMIQNANSRGMIEKYHVVELMRVARKVQAYWSRETERRRKEKVRNVLAKHRVQFEAACCGAQ